MGLFARGHRMGQRGQGEDSSAIEDIIYKLTGVRCKINGHRVALFFALLLFVFQVVAVQPGYDHWARIKKEVDHPIDCSELSCYEYDDYEVTYGLSSRGRNFAPTAIARGQARNVIGAPVAGEGSFITPAATRSTWTTTISWMMCSP